MDRCICKRSAWTAIIGIIILTLLSSEAASSSPPCIIKEIDETFGGLSDDWGYSIQHTSDGGYIIAGTTNSYGSGKSDIWLKKIDPEGKEIWNSTFGGTRDDEAYSVQEIDQGGFIVTGKTRSHGSGAYDAWLIRTDQNGNKVWDKTFGGPLDDEGFSVYETGDGGFIVAGRTRSKSGNGYYDVWLIKTDQYGNKIWDKTFGGPMDDVGDFVQQTNDGGYIIVGTTNSFGAGGSDVLLIKTDPEGNEIWDRIYGGSKSEQNPWSKGWSVLQNSEGGYMLVGSTDSFGAGGYDIWLIKTDENGELISDRTYGGPFNDEGGSIIQLGDNEYILVGSTDSYGAGGYDAWLIKIDKNGNIIWDQTYGGVTDDKGYSIEKTDDEGYIFVGKKKSDHGLVPQTGGCCQVDQPRIGANFDLWLIKTKSGSPTLKSQPQSITTCPGEEVAFNVEASGTEPLSFQWKKDGTEIAGAVSDIYGIPEVSASDSGSYSVIVSNDCGWVESDQASLIVYSRPSILTQPISQEVSEDSDLILKVEAEGTEPLAYQWKKGEDEIPGANSNIIRIPSAVPDHAGSYSVIVSNACGLVESLPAVVTVNLKPVIQVQPIYEETCEGSEVKFNAEATGTEPLFYQWKRNGENITGANSDIYFIPEAAVADAGSYSVAVSNCCGQIESIVANLTVKDKTAIKAHPASQIGCEGSEVTFAVEATGTEPLTYQWKKNGENITGANARTYTLQSIQKEDAGSYHVLVSSCCCGIAESNPADLTVNTKPAIQIQPASQVACEGSEVSFEIEATGTEPLSYQWIKDGAEIPGANSQSYSISNVTASDAGGYSAIISNCCGLAISEVASLKVESKPSIYVQPQDQVACDGAEITFSIQASGSEPLSYQWRKDGADIPGANATSLIIPNVNSDNAGRYSVAVSNACGQVVSDEAALEVNLKPYIVVQPQSQAVCEGAEVAFNVQAAGTEPLSYQWRKDGADIPGANATSLIIPSVSGDNAGRYNVGVSNTCEQVVSDEATLEVDLKPVIVVQPQSQVTCEGAEAVFSIQATGTEPLSYQWRKDGADIPGANATSLIIPSVTGDNAGRYSVAVSNSCEQVVSDEATLEVNLKPVIVVQPQSQVTCEGAEVVLSIQATGTEPLSYQWRKDGADIPGANATSLIIPSVTGDNAGRYSVAVSNSCEQVVSDEATLEVDLKPVIVVQPQSQVTCEGAEVVSSIQATGTEPLSYQWRKDGADIPGANATSLIIPSVSSDSAGNYSAAVSNACGQAVSDEATLEVNLKPVIVVQPQSQVTCEGSEVVFSIQATGTEPLSYQWRKDGTEIPGANATSLIIPGAISDNAGRYSVAVSNACGQVVSDEATLEVNLRPYIVVQPQSQVTCEGAEVVFGIQATGTEPLSYQWRKDGADIPGANATSLIIPSVSSDSAGRYSVAVSNSCGQVVSDEATLEVDLKPIIVVQPQSQAVCEGSEVAFNVQAAGTEPLSYQWRKDGADIPGANAASLIVPGVSSDSAGRYSVAVSNTCEQVVSDEATLEVNLKPVIVVQPMSQVTCEGAEVVFSIQATGTEPLSYQWRKDGAEIPGANATSLIIPNVNSDSAGRYSVAVSNSCGQVVSDEATLEVNLKPVIVVQPMSQVTCEGAEVVFSIQATGTEPLSYQWRKDGADIPGANATSLIIPSVSSDSAGRYSVAVSNSCGQVVSDEATLEVDLKPVIVVQPQSQVVCEGSEAAFSVQATGTEPLSYRWIKDGAEIPGANSDSYAISSATAAEVGSYSVAVSNCCGLSISNVATLAVNQIPSIIAQPEDQTVCAGSKASFSVVADGIEPLRYQWSKDDKIIEGANASSYEIPSADMGSTGSYSVAVSNSCGQAASNAAFLYVLVEPSILAQPESQTVCEGSEITFRVQAAGSEPLRYQWRKDSIEIPGAIESAYSISAVSLSDTGSYTVAVANDCEQIISEAAVLDMMTKPSIQVQPESQVVCEGSEVTFRVEATGSEPLAYQWKKDGADIEGANLSYYQILCVAAADTGIYSVVVSDRCGQAESDPAFLTVGSKPAIKTQPVVETPPVFCCKPDKDIQQAANAHPAIVVQPSSQVVCEGSIAKLSAECEGLRPMSFQWKRDGVAIPGANSNKYAIFNAALEDEGRYSVVATNCYGSSESCPAELRVIGPPIVIALPECQVANVGAAASFIARTRGTGPISYQWKKNGVAIPGAVFATYSIACVGPSDAGCYQVVAANGCCLSESNEITLKVPKAVPNSCRPKQLM